jgi:uncharacterized repeat protein (TIGR01451 family)
MRLAAASAVVLVLLSGAAVASAAPKVVSDCAVPNTCGLADLVLTGTVSPTTAQVGDTLTWQLTVNDINTYPALSVTVDVTLPSNVQVVSTYADRGPGCTSTGATTLHCNLDWLSKDVQFGHLTIVAKVTAPGDHALTAVTGYSGQAGPVNDPNPGNNTVTVTATTPLPSVLPVIAAGVASPAVKAGKTVTVSFNVTRSDNSQAMTDGTMVSASTLGTATIAHTQVFTNGVAQVTVTIPKTKVKGKKLLVAVTITSSTGGTASKTAKFTVH